MIRKAGFRAAALRSQPLVRAIKNYEAKVGQPPSELAALVPHYLSEVPGTGMAAYPKFEYVTGEVAHSQYHGNPWILQYSTPTVGIGFDRFVYFPRQNYPEHGRGGSIEKIDDWAYVHE